MRYEVFEMPKPHEGWMCRAFYDVGTMHPRAGIGVTPQEALANVIADIPVAKINRDEGVVSPSPSSSLPASGSSPYPSRGRRAEL